MKWLALVLMCGLPVTALAQGRCREFIPDEVWQQRQRDLDATVDRAMKARKWVRLPARQLTGFAEGTVVRRTLRLADGGVSDTELTGATRFRRLRPGDVLEPPPAEDGGVTPRLAMSVGQITQGNEERTVFVRSSEGEIFAVSLELTERPTKVVQSCACRHSGHEPPPIELVVDVDAGQRWVDRVETLAVTLRSVQVRARADAACGEVP